MSAWARLSTVNTVWSTAVHCEVAVCCQRRYCEERPAARCAYTPSRQDRVMEPAPRCRNCVAHDITSASTGLVLHVRHSRWGTQPLDEAWQPTVVLPRKGGGGGGL